MIHQSIQPGFEHWRFAARSLLQQEIEPREVMWSDTASGSLFAESIPLNAAAESNKPANASPHRVPWAFMDLARLVACHRDGTRWGLLYRVLWRLTHGEPRLLGIAVDDDIHRLLMMHQAVRRDRHKMTAFVRFRKMETPTHASDALDAERPDQYVAWHRPDHFIVRLTTPFFVRRFASLRWSILTPDESVIWDGTTARFAPGVPESEAPKGDALEALWRTYYANTFNPARINVRAMKREMPVRHWKTLPETSILPDLIRDAPRRVEAMVAKVRRAAAQKSADAPEVEVCHVATSAAEFVPASRSLPVLAKAATQCQGCSLYCNATQVVFGEGPPGAAVMFVGEQPGDQEDRAGKPFVGPSGQLLDDVMRQAGIPREEVYVTNAVKHFKFEPRGKRRIHAKPSAREVSACRPWLEAEIEIVKPEIIVCLGATAAQSLMGPAFRVTQHRGEAITDTKWSPWVMATVHPSSLLRVPDASMREQAMAQYLMEMKKIAKRIQTVKRRNV